MIRKISILLIVLLNSAAAQTASEKLSKGMKEFSEGNLIEAYSIFDGIVSESEISEKIIAASQYYKAECLVKMNKIESAAGEFEFFVKTYPLSNFREHALYELGTIYFETGDYSRTRRRLFLLLKDYPETEHLGSALYWIGKAFSAEKMYADAEEIFLHAVTERQTNEFVDYSIYSLARLYESLEDYTNAVTYYDELLAYYNDSELAPSAQLRIGVCYFWLGEYDSAVIELSDPLTKKLPMNQQAEVKYVLANSYFKLKEFDKAEEIYNEIDFDTNNRSNFKVRYALAWVQFQMKQFEDAFRLFDGLAQENADTLSSNSLFWSAECKRYLGAYDDALDIFEYFVQKYPDHRLVPKARYSMGIIYYNGHSLKRAERYFLFSINSDDKETKARAFTLLGEIKLHNQNFREAGSYFQRAVKIPALDENLSNQAILGLGVSQFYQNRYDDALLNFHDLSARASKFEIDKVNFYTAESYFQKKDYSSAVKHYARVTSNDISLFAQALYGRAYSHFNMKDYANAVYYFREFEIKFKNNDKYDDAKLRLADSYYGTKNYEEASRLYSEVFKENKKLLDNDFNYFQFGQALYRAGNSEEAVKKFEAIQLKFPNSNLADDSQYLVGWIKFQSNDFYGAIENYRKVYRNYPRSPLKPIAYYSIGDSYYNLGSYDSALVYYNLIFENYSDTKYVFDAVNGIYYCYLAQDTPESSISLINEFVAANPNSEYADKILFKKGEIYYNQYSYALAKISYKEFIASYPKSDLIPEAFYWIGKCSGSLGEKSDAEYYFGILIEKYPTSQFSESAVLELGEIYSADQDYESAIRLYDSAVDYLSESKRIPEMLFAKAGAQMKNNDEPGAYNTYETIITYYDKSLFAAKSKIELGLLEMGKEHYENAEVFFRDLAVNRNDDLGAASQYYFGKIQFLKGIYEDAISAFVRVRSVFPAYDKWRSLSLLGLGDCYVKIGEKKKAREMYRAVIKKHPKDEIGKEAKAKLRKL